jgi:hypothetical protein
MYGQRFLEERAPVLMAKLKKAIGGAPPESSSELDPGGQ